MASEFDYFGADQSLMIESCFANLSFTGDDDNLTVALASSNLTAGGGATMDAASWYEMCEALLASLMRPTPDPRRHARHMLNYLLMGVAGMTVGCFGLIGNLLSAIVLTRRTMTTSTYCYLAALAMCDFLVVACTLVLLIKDTQRPDPEWNSWPPSDHGSFYPYVFPYLHPAAITLQVSSVWLTLAFTVDRYIMICHPFKSEPFCTVGRARRVIAALVAASVVFNLPKFFEYRTVVVRPPPAAVQMAAGDAVTVVGCDLTELGNSRLFKQLYHSWLYIVCVFGVPFLSLVVLNAFLANAVRMARQRSHDLRPPSRRDTPNLDETTTAYQLEQEDRLSAPGMAEKSAFHKVAAVVHFRISAAYQLEGLNSAMRRSPSPVTRRIDTTVMLIGVVIIFIVCQFPALVSRTIWAFADDPSRAFTAMPLYTLNETANFLVLLNSSVNIIPYYFFGRRFRRQFLALFCPYCARRCFVRTVTSDDASDEDGLAWTRPWTAPCLATRQVSTETAARTSTASSFISHH